MEAGSAAESALKSGDSREAWQIVRAWYTQAAGHPLKPSRKDLETVTDERIELYTREDPTEDPIPVLAGSCDIDDDVPTEQEIAQAVRRLRNGKAAGPSKIRAEKLKEWLQEAEGEVPDRTKWDLLVDLVQTCFQEQSLPSQMVWSTVVLLPKGGGGFRGIGLLEIIWKLIESIINRRIMQKVKFHDCLHGFVPKRGTGTGCIEAKLVQQLHRIAHKVLFTVFVDLKKAFDTVHRERLLDILEGYGVGPRLRGLLRFYWMNQQCVARQSNYHGKAFRPTRGVTQGGVISPTLFNILVDAVVRKWLFDIMEDKDISISGLQDAVEGKISLFPHLDLESN